MKGTPYRGAPSSHAAAATQTIGRK